MGRVRAGHLERYRFEIYDQKMTRTERNRPGYAERAAGDTTDAVLEWAGVALREPWHIRVPDLTSEGPVSVAEPT